MSMGEKMSIIIKKFSEENADNVIRIWNDVVKEGNAFPQTDTLDHKDGIDFFEGQSYTGAAVDDETGEIVGMYILHPNNVGRCGHICNASYAVDNNMRGKHIGDVLVTDCMKKAKELGFKILHFNAVVATNEKALRLYKRLGFTQLGVIPKGFKLDSEHYEDIIPHYIEL